MRSLTGSQFPSKSLCLKLLLPWKLFKMPIGESDEQGFSGYFIDPKSNFISCCCSCQAGTVMSSSSGKKVWWRCALGHEWKAFSPICKT
jgi:hypothetical protein